MKLEPGAVAAHYGTHAYDNWDADEMLRLASSQPRAR
jgi:hypothetical protein